MTLYILDVWTGEFMDVFFDTILVSETNYTTDLGNNVNICGASYPDIISHLMIINTHSASNFNLTIQSNISSSLSGYWGVRELIIYLNVSCPALCISCIGNVCNSLVPFARQDSYTNNTGCEGGFFFDEDVNSCNLCDYTCMACNGRGPYNCTFCFELDRRDPTMSTCNHTSII